MLWVYCIEMDQEWHMQPTALAIVHRNIQRLKKNHVLHADSVQQATVKLPLHFSSGQFVQIDAGPKSRVGLSYLG
jgi:hypothetical protein